MTEPLVAAAAAVASGAIAWLLTRAHERARAAAAAADLRARGSGLEAVEAELRRGLAEAQAAAAELRRLLDVERDERAQAEARWAAAREGLAEQRQAVEELRERAADAFRALSAAALEQSAASLVERAREVLDAQLASRHEAIERTVRPLADALERYERQARELEASRQQAYGSLEQHLRVLAASSVELQRETGQLVTALRAPQVRGRWGELTLQRVVELAGMAEHCDYAEQVTVEAEGGRLRPDMVVHLPGGRDIVVDAKVPLAAYLDALGAATTEERRAALGRHAQQLRQHMGALAGKAYWEQFPQAPELVVMFIPGEAFVAAAAEADPTLIDDGLARGVAVATPTTLIALLKAIAYGWRQERLATNAAEVSALGRQLYDRLRTMSEHFADLGGALGRATGAFNRAVGSMESRVLPAARRFRDLGAATGGEVPALEAVDVRPRALGDPETAP